MHSILWRCPIELLQLNGASPMLSNQGTKAGPKRKKTLHIIMVYTPLHSFFSTLPDSHFLNPNSYIPIPISSTINPLNAFRWYYLGKGTGKPSPDDERQTVIPLSLLPCQIGLLQRCSTLFDWWIFLLIEFLQYSISNNILWVFFPSCLVATNRIKT